MTTQEQNQILTKTRKIKWGWFITCWFFFSTALGIGIWFFAYRLSTEAEMDTWASYAGKLQAGVWFQEGHYRLLELAPDERSQFTGRTNGPFEIWTWTHYTNSSLLSVPMADQWFIEAFNSRMQQLWDGKQRGTNATIVP
jgi:hypothetical protein